MFHPTTLQPNKGRPSGSVSRPSVPPTLAFLLFEPVRAIGTHSRSPRVRRQWRCWRNLTQGGRGRCDALWRSLALRFCCTGACATVRLKGKVSEPAWSAEDGCLAPYDMSLLLKRPRDSPQSEQSVGSMACSPHRYTAMQMESPASKRTRAHAEAVVASTSSSAFMGDGGARNAACRAPRLLPTPSGSSGALPAPPSPPERLGLHTLPSLPTRGRCAATRPRVSPSWAPCRGVAVRSSRARVRLAP